MNTARSRVEFWFALVWGVMLRLFLVGGFIYCLYRVRFIIVTVLVSVLLAVGIAPLVQALDTPRVVPFVRPATRRFLVTLFVFLMLLTLVVGSYRFLLRPVGIELSMLISNWPEYAQSLQNQFQTLKDAFERLPPDVQSFLKEQDLSALMGSVAAYLRGALEKTWHSTWVIMDLLLIPVLAYYFVVDSRTLKKEFIFLVPRRRVREALILLRASGGILKSYVFGQVILALVAGVVVGVALSVLGINYALAMGVVAAITRVVPIVGPILGGIPIVLLSTAQSWQLGVWVLIFFSLLHLFESKILMPKLIGYQIRLHPAIIIIVLLIGSEFFGLIGMFLAVPIAAIIKILINFYIIRPRERHFDRLGRIERGKPRVLGRAPSAEDLEIEPATLTAPGGRPGSH
jgi:predicted PurR-regulated permease PerM